MKHRIIVVLSGLLLALCGNVAVAQQAMGKIVLDIKPFSTEVTLKKKVEATLKTGGLEWGAKDGQVVITMVNKRFVNFDMPNFTRFDSKTEIDVPAGDYSITAIGFIPSTSFSPEKALAKGAFFNERIVSFKVEAGKASTITIRPVIQKNATFLLDFFQPALLTTVTSEGVDSPEVSIAAKNDKSIAWPAYTGPLKFVAK
jgi:hypothetical protein